MPQQKSVVLSDEKMQHILNTSVAKSQCKPKKLFVVKENNNGTTTDWQICQRFTPTLSLVLEETGGNQLTMKPFTMQLKNWLAQEDFNWSMGDIEASADGFRVMIRSLRAMKENYGKPPRNYGSLQVLLDKINVVTRDDNLTCLQIASSDEESSSDTESPDCNDHVPRTKPDITRSLMLPWEMPAIVRPVNEHKIAETQAIVDKTDEKPKRRASAKRPSINVGFDLETTLAAQPTEQNDIIMVADYKSLSKAAKKASKKGKKGKKGKSKAGKKGQDKQDKPGQKGKNKKQQDVPKDVQQELPEDEEQEVPEDKKQKAAKNPKESKSMKTEKDKIKKDKAANKDTKKDKTKTPKKDKAKKKKETDKDNGADLLQKYMDWDGQDPTRAVMCKRVHSKVWHTTKDQQIAYGMSDEKAKTRAATDANSAVERWLNAMRVSGMIKE
jgi:hypothetical protein